MSTFGLRQNIGTFTLDSEILNIIGEYGVLNISFLLVSGTVTVTGVMNLGARTSDPITLEADKPLNLGSNFPIDGLLIDASSGVVTIVTGK
jgi:hypothetical protein